MDFKPITAVWEITMGCNMRCKHCGSSCETSLEGELSTEEALNLCDDIAEMGFEWITISGGEPTTRKDWNLIAGRLNEKGVMPTMITNGWLFNEEVAQKAKNAGVRTVAFSVDGLKETHDFMRREGSFDRIMNAIDILNKLESKCTIITTVNKRNLKELNEMKEVFLKKGIKTWQLQLALPMGNMAHNRSMVADPEQVDDVINFAYDVVNNTDIEIHLADCLGYFNNKEIEVRRKSDKTDDYQWQGCNAGKYSMGILNNGDILGCTSIRDREFIEGNIRETLLKDIWNNPNNFSWNREIDKEKIEGFCSKCMFGSLCKGGCANTRLTHGGSVYAENKYCSYSLALNKLGNQFEVVENVDEILERARKFMGCNNAQLAQILLEKNFEKHSENIEFLNLYQQVSSMLENHKIAKEIEQKILKINSDADK